MCCPDDKLDTRICKCCRSKIVNSKAYRNGERFCAECRPLNTEGQEKKRTEHVISPILDEMIGFKSDYSDNFLLGSGMHAKDCEGLYYKKRRPDKIYRKGLAFVCIEIDEHSHFGYCTGSDAQWIADTATLLRADNTFENYNGPVPILFIRLNPDEYDKELVSLQKRCRVVADEALAFFNYVEKMGAKSPDKPFLEEDYDELRKINISFRYYHSKCADRIDTHRQMNKFANIVVH